MIIKSSLDRLGEVMKMILFNLHTIIIRGDSFKAKLHRDLGDELFRYYQ